MTKASPPPGNPFDALGLPTDADPQDLTMRLRERIEDAKTEQERTALRSAWEELTLHPERRVELAIRAFPTGKEGPRMFRVPQARPKDIAPVTLSELVDETPLSFLVPCAPLGEDDPAIDQDPLLALDAP